MGGSLTLRRSLFRRILDMNGCDEIITIHDDCHVDRRDQKHINDQRFWILIHVHSHRLNHLSLRRRPVHTRPQLPVNDDTQHHSNHYTHHDTDHEPITTTISNPPFHFTSHCSLTWVIDLPITTSLSMSQPLHEMYTTASELHDKLTVNEHD